MKTLTNRFLILSIASTLLFSCSGNDDTDSTDDVVDDLDSGITMLFKTTAEGEPEYILSTDSVTEGSISAEGSGIESLEWNYVYNVGSSIFTIGTKNFIGTTYQENDNGEVAQVSSFQATVNLEAFGQDGDDTFLAIDAPRLASHSDRTLYTIDAETGTVTSQVTLSIYDIDTGTPGEGVFAWPIQLEVVGDKLYIPFHALLDDASFATPDADTAKIAVFDYPVSDGATPIAIITSDITGEIGTNGNNSLIQTESGDLYCFHSGAYYAGFVPRSTKESGILKINNGEAEFDSDYFLNVEEATGGKMFWMDYVGDNKVLARILTEDIDEASYTSILENAATDGLIGWYAAYGRGLFNQKLVIIDLKAETITDVENVPLHAKRSTAPLNEIDGSYYVSIETESDVYVYDIDIDGAIGTQGAKVEGKTIKGFFKL